MEEGPKKKQNGGYATHIWTKARTLSSREFSLFMATTSFGAVQ